MANEIASKSEQQASLVVNNSFIDSLTQQLMKKKEFGLEFPSDYNVANALTGAYLVLKETKDRNNQPVLKSCSQASIANALMDMATTGLNVQKKQGYFIAYGGQCQFQRSYFGNVAIARRYGLEDINAQCIYQGDDFKYAIVDGKKVFKEHTQDFLNIDNDKIVGAYAVATMHDGTRYLEVMNMAQIKQAWKQGYGYKEGSASSTHNKFGDQMAMKTVKNRLLKQIINTHGDAFVNASVEATEAVPEEERVVASQQNDIDVEANTVDFEEEVEKVEGEVVEEVSAEPADDEVADFMKED